VPDYPPRPAQFNGPLDVLRLRRFAAFWLSGVASNTGTWVQRTIAMVWVWDVTHDALAVGLLAAAATLPVLIFAVPAGLAVDRFERRRVIIVTHLISSAASLCLAGYTALSGQSAIAPIAVAFILATSWAFAKPALSAYFPSLVPREAMRAATAANSLSFIGGQVLGPVIGSLFVLAGEQTAGFLINAVTFVVPVLIVARLPAAGNARTTAATAGPWTASVRDALPMRNLALLGVIAVAAGAADVLRNLAPVVVAAVGANQELTGLVVMSVSVGSGAGALTSGWVARHAGDGRGVAVGLTIQAASLMLLAAWFEVPVLLVAAAGTGLGFSWAFVLLTSELQLRTPDGLRGTVMSMHSLAHLGVRPVGTLLTSLAVGGLGVVVALAANGVVAIAALSLVAASKVHQHMPVIEGTDPEAGLSPTPDPGP
jgi:MFS family permease